MNKPQPKLLRNPPLRGFNGSTTIFLFPQSGVPFLQFFPGNLSIPHGSNDTLMAQMLLQHPDPIAAVISLDCAYRKVIPQPMWANPVHPASLRVEYIRQPGVLSTPPDYLPSSVPADSKYQPPAAANYRTTSRNVVFDHSQCFAINR